MNTKKAVAGFILLLITFSPSTIFAADAYAKVRGVKTLEGSLTGGEHTFGCLKGGAAKERCYSQTGGNDGGSTVKNTKHASDGMLKCVYDNGGQNGACHVNIEVGFLDDRRNGSCHQEVNHMLRTANRNWTGGPTVNRYVGGGDYTAARFGLYGIHDLAQNCVRVCQ